MVNFLGKFIPNLSEITEPVRMLLKKDTEFIWLSQHDVALGKIKQTLVGAPVLSYFDVDKPATIQCDASKGGLGCCLFQESHPVAHASRSLNTAEVNYAQIEKELLQC
jgi:hypothetical protein